MPPRHRLNDALGVFEDLWRIGFGIADQRNRLNGSVHRRPQQIAVTVLRHPTRTGQMTVMDASGALTILVRIKPEQDAYDLCPLRSLLRCVE